MFPYIQVTPRYIIYSWKDDNGNEPTSFWLATGVIERCSQAEWEQTHYGQNTSAPKPRLLEILNCSYVGPSGRTRRSSFSGCKQPWCRGVSLSPPRGRPGGIHTSGLSATDYTVTSNLRSTDQQCQAAELMASPCQALWDAAWPGDRLQRSYATTAPLSRLWSSERLGSTELNLSESSSVRRRCVHSLSLSPATELVGTTECSLL